MNALDEFLDAIGISSATQETQIEPANPTVTMPQPSQESELQPLSQEDVDNILVENGFPESQEAEAEEIVEEEDAVVEEMEDETIHEEAHNNDIEIAVVPSVSTEVPSSESMYLPENSPTLLLDESTSRFSGAEWYNKIKNSRIILAGLGGIGSWCAIQLARLSPFNITLYDDDIIEAANMSGQFYGRGDIGLFKTDAIYTRIREFTSTSSVYCISEKFTSDSEAGNLMICGFDNMKSRKVFYLSWKNHVLQLDEEERKECLFLDGRLSMDCLQVLAIRGNDEYNMNRYEKEFLFSDAKADETVCSMKQTTYLACMIGSFIVNLFTNFMAETLSPVFPYAVPFFTEYDAQSMIFKAEN